ncbi:hypothetical protein Dimus_014371 [Dionaea muscipula]
MAKKIDGAVLHTEEYLHSSNSEFRVLGDHVNNGSTTEAEEFTEIDIVKGESVSVEENPATQQHSTQTATEEIPDEETSVTVGANEPGNFTQEAAATAAKGSVVEHPLKDLPQPAAPHGLLKSRSYPGVTHPPQKQSENFPIDVPAIGRFLRERSSSLKAEISKRINNFKDYDDEAYDEKLSQVTEFTLSGIKVIVQEKERLEEPNDEKINDVASLKGRVTFFSRSNCRDCRAVRSFLRETRLKYSEINVDVFPMRERELIERTGGSTVPQIFFNEKLIGGLVAFNSLRNSGLLVSRLWEMLSVKCPDDAPEPPVYGFDDPEEDRTDELAAIVRILRQRLPIQDRLIKMRIVKNCFTGIDLVDVLLRHLNCRRTEAVEIGEELARKHYIHHVFGGNEFQDGNQIYRFLEHELFIKKCFNFCGCTDEREPKAAAVICQQLGKIMSAILESYASEDGRHVDYVSIKNSEEFRRYLNLVQGLHRVDILALSSNEKLAFFLNLYNAMVIHGMIRKGYPDGMIERKSLVTDFQYLIGGHSYSLSSIKNGLLRSNRRPLYSLVKPFNAGDNRLELALPAVNPLIHFGLCDGTKSCPPVKFFTYQNVEAELRAATREFFQRGGVEVDLAGRTVYLSCIFKWYNVDFGSSVREILKWMKNYLDANRAGLLTHLLRDGGVANVVYQRYDWSLNS